MDPSKAGGGGSVIHAHQATEAAAPQVLKSALKPHTLLPKDTVGPPVVSASGPSRAFSVLPANPKDVAGSQSRVDQKAIASLSEGIDTLSQQGIIMHRDLPTIKDLIDLCQAHVKTAGQPPGVSRDVVITLRRCAEELNYLLHPELAKRHEISIEQPSFLEIEQKARTDLEPALRQLLYTASTLRHDMAVRENLLPPTYPEPSATSERKADARRVQWGELPPSHKDNAAAVRPKAPAATPASAAPQTPITLIDASKPYLLGDCYRIQVKVQLDKGDPVSMCIELPTEFDPLSGTGADLVHGIWDRLKQLPEMKEALKQKLAPDQQIVISDVTEPEPMIGREDERFPDALQNMIEERGYTVVEGAAQKPGSISFSAETGYTVLPLEPPGSVHHFDTQAKLIAWLLAIPVA